MQIKDDRWPVKQMAVPSRLHTGQGVCRLHTGQVEAFFTVEIQIDEETRRQLI